ncbi:MAG TPA: winged helix-turn-helix domain-containing protein [Candidatus Solibacter sp.]|nr:winged helix-turn-helix domain-containing protein [Candidatus Solibacter sp.]
MNRQVRSAGVARFGSFELDLQTGELRNDGKRIVLPGQPFRVLTTLLERSGQLVTREELKKELWPLDTFVEFDQGLNKAINRLRESLEDDAGEPKFIETLPRRGYRWIATVGWERDPQESVQTEQKPASSEQAASGQISPSNLRADSGARLKRPRMAVLAVALAVLISGGAGLLAGRKIWQQKPPEFHRLTFQRGYIPAARFSSDGETIVYSAAWEGGKPELLSTRPDYPGYRSLGLSDANLIALSSTGQIALTRAITGSAHVGNFVGTLALAPLAGGSARDVQGSVVCGDWTPDGARMALVRIESDSYQLEFPAGKVLYRSIGYISNPRISQNGKLVAFLDHPQSGDDRGAVMLIDAAGKARALTGLWMGGANGLAWSADGKEIWFTAASVGSGNDLLAVDLNGHVRAILRAGIRLVLQDISARGQVLLTEENERFGIIAQSDAGQRDLSWLDYSFLTGDLSPDGNSILFSEQGEGAGPNYSACIRKLDGTPAVRLGEGMPTSISPDGKWVTSVLPDSSGRVGRIELLPTGAGQPISVVSKGIQQRWGSWFPRTNRILITGKEPGKQLRSYVQAMDDPTPKPFTPEGVVAVLISPDEKYFLAEATDGGWDLYSIDGRNPKHLSIGADEVPMQWSADGKSLYLRRGDLRAEIYRWDLATGKKILVQAIAPADQAGLLAVDAIIVGRDEKTYIYGYARITSDLFLVDRVDAR